MRRFVDEIVLRNGPLAFDIIHALENNKNVKYEVDMCDKEVFNEATGRRSNSELIQLKIYIKEDMTDKVDNGEQLSMNFN